MNTTQSTANAAGAANVPKARLLVVDDEVGPRESVKIVFKDELDVVTADCGQKAIEYASTSPVDVAVVDIRMPDLSGIDVLRKLKQLDPNTEVLMLTAYETLDTARDAIRYGASDYLNKPFDVRLLRETVGRCIENRRRKLSSLIEIENLQKRNVQLQREVLNTNRALTAGVLSAGIIHDVNNPLSIIMIKTELMIENNKKKTTLDKTDIDTLNADLSLIHREVVRARNITRRFLDLSRRREGQLELMEASAIIEDVMALLKAHPLAADKELRQTVEGGSLLIRANPTEVLQILVNLGMNSLQAMKAGGKLTLSARCYEGSLRDLTAPSDKPAVVTFSSTLDEGRKFVELAVTDNGHGIPKDVLPRILEPYFTTKLRGEGTGLGMAICAQLVDNYHGALKITSEVNVGTTSAVYLPMASK